MNLLLVIPALGPVYGGPSRIAPALAAALARRDDVRVDLVTTAANGPADLDVPLNRWLPQDGGAWRLRYFPRHGRTELKPSWPMARWLWENVRRYDLVHHQSVFNLSAAGCALACRARGVPYLINPQGMLEPWALGHKAGKKRAYYLLLERPLVLRGARALHALNGREAANLDALRIGPPVVVIPNGINPAESQPAAADAADAAAFRERFPATRGRRLILFLHRVDPKKGLDVLAASYERVRSEFPDAHIVVAGPDNVGFAATARGFFDAAGAGGEEAVTFTGMLEGALKRGAFAAASVFVAPSYSEGFSMSVLEAMAAGLPCVITEGCNFPEAAAARAARVTRTEAGDFAVALLSVLRDGAEAAAMGARGQRLVLERYTWDGIAAQTEAACRALLEGRPLPAVPATPTAP